MIWFGRHRITRRLLATYLILVAIPCIGTLVTYQRATTLLKQDRVATNLGFLENAGNALDQGLEELERTVTRLLLNQDISAFLSMKYPDTGSPEIIKVITAARAVSLYRVRDEMLLDFFLFSRLNDIIISTERVHTDIESDYETFYAFSGLSFDQFREMFLETYHESQFFPEMDLSVADKAYRVIPYAQSVPFRSRQFFNGTIIAYLDTQRLDDLVRTITNDEFGNVYLIDADGTVLHETGNNVLGFSPATAVTQVGNEPTAEYRSKGLWLISQHVSERTGIRLVSVLPYSTIQDHLAFIRNIFIVVTALLIVVGILASFILSYVNGKPIVEISEFVLSHAGSVAFDGHDLSFIRQNMSELIETNRELSAYKRSQLPIMRTAFLGQLVQGQFKDDSQIQPLLQHNEVHFRGPVYNVTLFKPAGYGSHVNSELIIEKDLFRMVLESEVDRMFPNLGYFVLVQQDRVAWIHSEPSPTVLKDGLFAISREMRERYNHHIYISRGGPRSALSELYMARTEASQGIEYLLTIADGQTIYHFDELPERTDTLRYDIDTESKLIMYTKTGQADGVNAIFDQIYRENLEQRRLTPQMARRLLDALETTSSRISDYFLEQPPEGIADAVDGGNSGFRSGFQLIRERFLSLCHSTRELKATRSRNLRASILEYIDHSFNDAGLNLSRLADEFGYKESYLYHYFLDFAGNTFASYLESMRISKAKEMLEAGKETIDTIAASTGYNSSHSFRRAFKRHTNLTPSQYQETLVNA